MTARNGKGAIGPFLRGELRELLTINPSDRPWQMPFATALSAGLPLFVGASLDRLADGVIASIGGMVFLYLPRTPLGHRMVTVTACAFGMIACYALGLLSHLLPVAQVPFIGLVAVLATMICRYYRLMPPGSLFLVMAAAIGAFAPGDLASAPHRLGIFALGCILACLIALLYTLHIRRHRDPLPVPPPPEDVHNVVILDSVLIGLFVALSLGAAQLLAMEKPYWVPVSCLAVIQGLSLRAVWNRQMHRIIGTVLGLGVTWALLAVVANKWEAAIAITLLTFIIETAVVRHYGFAALFITPLTILLAEAPTLGHVSSQALITARLADTVVGSIIGFIGGLCLHSAKLRRILHRLFRPPPG